MITLLLTLLPMPLLLLLMPLLRYNLMRYHTFFSLISLFSPLMIAAMMPRCRLLSP